MKCRFSCSASHIKIYAGVYILLFSMFALSPLTLAGPAEDFMRKKNISELSAAKMYRAFLIPQCKDAHRKERALHDEIYGFITGTKNSGRRREVVHKDLHNALNAFATCLNQNGSDYPPPLSAYKYTVIPHDTEISFNLDVLLGYRKLLEKKYANIGNMDVYIASLEPTSSNLSQTNKAEIKEPIISPPPMTSDSESDSIIIEDDITIDDIAKLRPAPLRNNQTQPARTCTCPAGTFEYYGFECQSISDRVTVTRTLGGHAFHKNCDATYLDPHRVSEF